MNVIMHNLEELLALYYTPGLCIDFDAHAQEGTYISAVHINRDTNYYMIDLEELPDNYGNQICSVLKELPGNYGNQICSVIDNMANFQHQLHSHDHPTLQETPKTMTQDITCSITDRATVNTNTIQLL